MVMGSGREVAMGEVRACGWEVDGEKNGVMDGGCVVASGNHSSV